MFSLLLLIYSFRLVYVESYSFAAGQNFAGDFRAAITIGDWWDGRQIIYGPTFTLIALLHNRYVGFFSLHFFWWLNMFTFLLAVLLWTTRIQKLRLYLLPSFVGLSFIPFTTWYSLQVTALPESLELLLIIGAWIALLQNKCKTAALLLAIAASIKLIPILFFLLAFCYKENRNRFSFISIYLLTYIGAFLVAALVLQRNVLRLFIEAMEPVLFFMTGRKRTAISDSEQFTGLGSFFKRLLDGDQDILITYCTFLLMSSLIVFILFMTNRVVVLEPGNDSSRINLMFNFLLCCLPIFTVAAHPHTYIFILFPLLNILTLFRDQTQNIKVVVLFAFIPASAQFYPLIFQPLYPLFNVLPFSISNELSIANLLLLLIYVLLLIRSRKVKVH